jgi:hypothetical protein
MKRMKGFVLCLSAAGLALALAGGLAACSEKPEQPQAKGSNSDPLADITNQPDRPRDVRPPPASSGIRNDPDNPNGVPGPSRGTGISSSRY